MYDRNQAGQAEPSFASSLPSPLHTSLPSSLPPGRRSTPPYTPMGMEDNSIFSRQGVLRTRLATLGGLLHLPTTLQGYLVFTFCLLILAFTMVLHVTLSAEIMRLDEKLIALKSDYEATEHKNAGLIYEIARYSSLQDVNRQAVLAGYVPATIRKYVVERSDIVDALNNPAPADLTPKYLILGNDPAVQAAPPIAQDGAPTESAAEGSFWSYFRWQSIRGALTETGTWLRSRMPAWGTP